MLHSKSPPLQPILAPSRATPASSAASPFSSVWRAVKRVKRHWVALCVIGVVAIIVFSGIPSLNSSRPELAIAGSYYGKIQSQLRATRKEGEDAGDDGAGVAPMVDHLYTFRQSESCRLSSLDLFVPSKPVCKDKQALLRAMSSGGRIGFDAPYSPRGCDMKWFSTAEICSILSRFSHVYLVGDSLTRNIMIAMHILLRQDLVTGGMRNWEPPPQETVGVDCSCNMVIENKDCSWFHGVFNSEHVYENDPASMACVRSEAAQITYHALTAHPISDEDLAALTENIPAAQPDKPVALIFSHGLWNDFEPEKTTAWLDQVVPAITAKAPWLQPTNAAAPYLLMTPNAGGEKKLEMHHALQNNFRLAKFEKKVGESLSGSGIDHLGLYNMSIQAYSWDGTHATMRTDLLKCMMIYNWLNAYDFTS